MKVKRRINRGFSLKLDIVKDCFKKGIKSDVSLMVE